MRKYQYKRIQKKITSEHDEKVFDVIGQIRKIGLNKYEFVTIRDKIYLEAERLYDERCPANDDFYNKLLKLSNKLTQKALKKSILENIGNLLFTIFVIITIALPITYGINFSNPVGSSIYSKGLYLHLNLYNLFLMVLCCIAGIVIATIIQRIEKNKKKNLIIITCCVGLVLCVLIYALSVNFPDFFLKINFLVFESLALVLSIGGYFLEDAIASKNYKEKHEDNKSKD